MFTGRFPIHFDRINKGCHYNHRERTCISFATCFHPLRHPELLTLWIEGCFWVKTYNCIEYSVFQGTSHHSEAKMNSVVISSNEIPISLGNPTHLSPPPFFRVRFISVITDVILLPTLEGWSTMIDHLHRGPMDGIDGSLPQSLWV